MRGLAAYLAELHDQGPYSLGRPSDKSPRRRVPQKVPARAERGGFGEAFAGINAARWGTSRLHRDGVRKLPEHWVYRTA